MQATVSNHHSSNSRPLLSSSNNHPSKLGISRQMELRTVELFHHHLVLLEAKTGKIDLDPTLRASHLYTEIRPIWDILLKAQAAFHLHLLYHRSNSVTQALPVDHQMDQTDHYQETSHLLPSLV